MIVSLFVCYNHYYEREVGVYFYFGREWNFSSLKWFNWLYKKTHLVYQRIFNFYPHQLEYNKMIYMFFFFQETLITRSIFLLGILIVQGIHLLCSVDSLLFVMSQFLWFLWVQLNNKFKCSMKYKFLMCLYSDLGPMKWSIQENTNFLESTKIGTHKNK